ncbi:hypothetical protein [Isoptericola sp. NPDC055881]
MADYTPTTDEMADAYTRMRVREATGETPGERILTAIDALSEFERGLAEHDRQVKAEALREALPLQAVMYYPGSDYPVAAVPVATLLDLRGHAERGE